jgi:hypothetical protein
VTCEPPTNDFDDGDSLLHELHDCMPAILVAAAEL